MSEQTGREYGQRRVTGEALLRDLVWVHDHIRSDLAAIMQLAADVGAGAPAAEIRGEVSRFAEANRVWTLRVNCMRYCKFVHLHHGFEDGAWFPALRKINPELGSVIDRLEADHLMVSDYLDEIEAAARELREDDASRARLALALERLGEHLLAHLTYEETSLAPTLRSLETWPLEQ